MPGSAGKDTKRNGKKVFVVDVARESRNCIGWKETGNNMPMLKVEDKQGNTILYVSMVIGVSTIIRGMPVCVTLQDGYLMIQQRFSKNVPAILRYSRITKVQEIRDRELVIKSINADGNAVISEVRLSRCSNNSHSKTHNSKARDYIVITYEATASKIIIFEVVKGTTIGTTEFIQEVQKKANIINKKLKAL